MTGFSAFAGFLERHGAKRQKRHFNRLKAASRVTTNELNGGTGRDKGRAEQCLATPESTPCHCRWC
jgi:hypothetical protein